MSFSKQESTNGLKTEYIFRHLSSLLLPFVTQLSSLSIQRLSTVGYSIARSLISSDQHIYKMCILADLAVLCTGLVEVFEFWQAVKKQACISILERRDPRLQWNTAQDSMCAATKQSSESFHVPLPNLSFLTVSQPYVHQMGLYWLMCTVPLMCVSFHKKMCFLTFFSTPETSSAFSLP